MLRVRERETVEMMAMDRFAIGAGLLALLALVGAGGAAAAQVSLQNAWMRPAPAGAATAKAYVDITSDAALELIGASTPAAKKVDLVLVTVKDTSVDEKIVKVLSVAAGKPTRLAFNGNHLQLSGITRDIGNGVPVPLTLTFRDAMGKQVQATTDILVRGLLRPEQVPAASTGKHMPAPEEPMVPKHPQPPPKM
jgi:periplasmic copper chaperone A